MKQLVILLALWLITFDHARAQQNYKETYKKAHDFTSTNPDSAMIWAEKCLELATDSIQKYQAHYLRAFNANKLCLHGQAINDYRLAAKTTTDSMSKYDVINSLAKTYFRSGQYIKASRLNNDCIPYFINYKHWESLSYAYELKGEILLKQQHYGALELFRKAVKLREKHEPKRIGFAYAEMAKAFAQLNMYDSAIIYRRKAIANYPLKSPDETANQQTLLAKHLLSGGKPKQALRYLQKAQQLKKNPMTELFWNHTIGLYFMRINASTEARASFTRCEALYQGLLAKAPDIITKRTISEYAQDMYADFMKLKGLLAMERDLYGAKLKTVKANLARYNSDIRSKDSLASHRIQIQKLKKAKADSLAKPAVETGTPKPQKQAVPKIKEEAQHYSMLYWLLGLGMAAALATWAGLRGFEIYRITTVKQEVNETDYKAMMTENFLVSLGLGENDDERLVIYKNKKLDMRNIAGNHFRGISYGKIGVAEGVPKTNLKDFCDALLTTDDLRKYKSFTKYREAFKVKWKKTSKFKIRSFFFPF